MERPQRGQCARAHMSSCWPQWQSLVRLQRARVWVLTDRVSVVVLFSMRVTSLISQVVSSVKETDVTREHDAETPGMARTD